MPNRTPLVCQYLEKISRDALEEYQATIRDYVRRRHGVYALYRRNRLYYVGLASNLRNRLRHHLKDQHGKSWDRFSVYLTIGDSHIKELESLILRVISPPGNKLIGKFARAENLRVRLGRAIRQQQRSELQELMGRRQSVGKQTRVPRSKRVKTGRKPVLAEYVTGKLRLKARYKGRTLRAFVRKSGSIRFKGRTYNSPSLAAIAVCRRSCNGWTFWSYERAPGDWVLLNTLRK